jgi:malate/lactate dehydrogenase
MLDGEYGVNGIRMSDPVSLGKTGVLEILE